ncbi:DUF975 family protein [Peptostreptococcus equinus]|uniref:DUF975 family protein n=1 Tax=Peptostreptococcus equinus TaxID=3003601 RepID=A0ABY7JRQ9_9FIRM|nr:DUF975 family protein [Peptostreptococcus sp. CBA3647]WAW15164.1 DUF975 family protein [Peptostreptococcus sp. CBA3647]
MLKNSEIRKLSRAQLSGKWGKMAIINLLVIAAIALMYTIMIKAELNSISIVFSLLTELLTFGLYKLGLDIANGKEVDASRFVLNKRQYLRALLYSILMNVIIFALEIILGIILFIVGAASIMGLGVGSMADPSNINELLGNLGAGTIIILLVIIIVFIAIMLFFSLAFAQSIYIILRDHDDIGAIDAMKLSFSIMKGYKWRLFCLNLSFIGWAILSVLTLGIGFLFLMSYSYVANANFYLELLKENEEEARQSGVVDREYEQEYRTMREEHNYSRDINDSYSEEKVTFESIDLEKDDTKTADKNDPIL